MKINNSTALTSRAQLIGRLNPSAWDGIYPHLPFPYSNAHVDLLAADLVRQISVELSDKALSQQAFNLSQQMARAASAALAATWDGPGDDICPPWPFPFPFPHMQDWFRLLEQTAKPEPQPWTPINSAEQVQLAHVLTQAASLTTDAASSKSLLQLATSVATAASRTLLADFERCGNRPRPKFPKKTLELKTQPA